MSLEKVPTTPMTITTIFVMLTDEGDEGDDGDAKKSNVVVAINWVTCFQKGQL